HVLGERRLLLYALHRFGEVLDEDRLRFLFARSPSSIASRPLLGLKDIPRSIEIAIGRVRTEKLNPDSGHVTLLRIDPSHQRIRHVSRILKIAGPKSYRQRHRQVKHGALLDPLAHV